MLLMHEIKAAVISSTPPCILDIKKQHKYHKINEYGIKSEQFSTNYIVMAYTPNTD